MRGGMRRDERRDERRGERREERGERRDGEGHNHLQHLSDARLEDGEGARDSLPQRQHHKLDEVELQLRLGRLRTAAGNNRGKTATESDQGARFSPGPQQTTAARQRQDQGARFSPGPQQTTAARQRQNQGTAKGGGVEGAGGHTVHADVARAVACGRWRAGGERRRA